MLAFFNVWRYQVREICVYCTCWWCCVTSRTDSMMKIHGSRWLLNVYEHVLLYFYWMFEYNDEYMIWRLFRFDLTGDRAFSVLQRIPGSLGYHHRAGTSCTCWFVVYLGVLIELYKYMFNLGCWIDPRNFFHFLVCLTDMTNTIARFFPCLTLSGTWNRSLWYVLVVLVV